MVYGEIDKCRENTVCTYSTNTNEKRLESHGNGGATTFPNSQFTAIHAARESATKRVYAGGGSVKDKSGVVEQPKRGRNVVADAERRTERGMWHIPHRRRSNAGRDKEPGTGHCPHNRAANVYNNLVLANSAGWQLRGEGETCAPTL